jgi:lysylphosphatidylglycerol synthetase-like protein (DUF2156 family)
MIRSISTIRFRALAIVLPLYGVAAFAMFLWPGMVSRVSDRCGGLPPFDVRGNWTQADARALVQACGASGRSAYIELQLLDLVYPALSGAALVLVTALLARRYGRWGWAALIPAVLMTVLDYTENIAVWTLLVKWPDVNATVAAIGGPVTAVKHIMGFVAFGIPLLLGVIALLRWLGGNPPDRVPAPGQFQPGP